MDLEEVHEFADPGVGPGDPKAEVKDRAPGEKRIATCARASEGVSSAAFPFLFRLMKRFLSASLSVALVSSCSFPGSILPEGKKTDSGSGAVTEIRGTGTVGKNAEGIEQVNVLDSGGVTLAEEPIVTERFKVISAQFSNYEDLFGSEQFRSFVAYVWDVFDKYKKMGGKEAELRYVFEKLIPKVVIGEWVIGKGLSMDDAEYVIQSIKRKNFTPPSEKSAIMKKFQAEVEKNVFPPIVAGKDAGAATKTDDAAFSKLFLDPDSGVAYRTLKVRYDIAPTGIGYMPSALENEFSSYVNGEFAKVLEAYGYSPEEFERRTLKILGYANVREYAEGISKNFRNFSERKDLKTKIPVDRFFRNDEQKDAYEAPGAAEKTVESICGETDRAACEAELKKFRLDMYLVSYFGRGKEYGEGRGLWNRFLRADFLDEEYGEGMTNLFGISRGIKSEKAAVNP